MKKWLIVALIFAFLLVFLGTRVEAQDLSQTLSVGQESFSRSFIETSLPDSIAQPIRVLFRVPESESMTLSLLIILAAVGFFVLIVILSMIKFVPFFSGWKAIAGALVISLLIMISGGVHKAASFFLGFISLGKWGSILIVSAALVLLIIGLGLAKLLKIVRDRVGVETAERMGENLSVQPLMEKLKEKRGY